MKDLTYRWRWTVVWVRLLLCGMGSLIALGPGDASAHCGSHDVQPVVPPSCPTKDKPPCCDPTAADYECCKKDNPGAEDCPPKVDKQASAEDGASDADTGDSAEGQGEGGEGGDDGGSCEEQSSDDPVRLFSGELIEEKYFLRLGGPLDMKIALTYGSQQENHSAVGYGWALNYGHRLYDVEDTNKPFVVRLGDGHRVDFEPAASNTYRSLDPFNQTLQINTNGSYIMSTRYGMRYAFDTDGKITNISSGRGPELRMTYNPTGRVPVIGRSRYSNLTTNMVVARDFELTRVDEYLGGASSGRYYDFLYDGTGHLTNVTDFAGRSISLTHSSAGELLQVTDAESNIFSYAYDELGRMQSLVGLGCSDCVVVSNHYDSAGRVTNQLQGSQGEGLETRLEYVEVGTTRVEYRHRLPGGGFRIRRDTRESMADAYGAMRLKKATVDYGFGVTNVVEHWYDTNALRTQTVINLVATNVFGYDGNKNLTYIRRQVSTNVFQVTTNTYDGQNNLTERRTVQTDQGSDPFVTKLGYDVQRRLTNETVVLSATSSITRLWRHNPAGLATQYVDARGLATAYEYDSRGYRVRECDWPTRTTRPSTGIVQPGR